MNPHPDFRCRRRAIRAVLIIPLLGAVAVAGPSLTSIAQAGDHADKAARKAQELAAIRAAVERGEVVPLPRIMELALVQVPGDVVKTELEVDHGRLTYEIKILTQTGQVREVKLDARAGTILRVEDD